MGTTQMIALADRGYYEGEQIRSGDDPGITTMVPKPNTSPAQARGFWGKAAFVYQPETDTYCCLVGEQLQKRHATVEASKLINVYSRGESPYAKTMSKTLDGPALTAASDRRFAAAGSIDGTEKVFARKTSYLLQVKKIRSRLR